MMLMEKNEAQHQSEYKLTLDKLMMAGFIESDRCQQEVMSLYLDRKKMVCRDRDMAFCD